MNDKTLTLSIGVVFGELNGLSEGLLGLVGEFHVRSHDE